jgi:hypothetical protein
MLTLRENMLFCEKWTRSFELETVSGASRRCAHAERRAFGDGVDAFVARHQSWQREAANALSPQCMKPFLAKCFLHLSHFFAAL